MEKDTKTTANSKVQRITELMDRSIQRAQKETARRTALAGLFRFKESVKREQSEYGLKAILSEVLLIAQSTGWSEHEILSMPEVRRKCYVSLIIEQKGMDKATR